MSPRGRRNSNSGGRYRLGGSGSSSPFREWEVDPELLHDAIKAVLENGDAVLFGATSDGGAVRVAVYSGDGDPEKGYAANLADFTSLLTALRDNALADR